MDEYIGGPGIFEIFWVLFIELHSSAVDKSDVFSALLSFVLASSNVPIKKNIDTAKSNVNLT